MSHVNILTQIILKIHHWLHDQNDVFTETCQSDSILPGNKENTVQK